MQTVNLLPTPELTGTPPVGFSELLGRIICGDNVEVLSGFPDACIDLVVTSPPYDDLRTYGGHSWNFETLAAQLVRVLKPGGVIVWVVADATVNGSETLTSMRQAIHFKDVCGLNVHDTMVYQKAGVSFPDTNRYYQNWEYMFVLSKGPAKTFNLLRDRRNIWAGQKVHSTVRNADGTLTPKACLGNITQEFGVRYNVWRFAHNLPGRCEHPATFPESLAKDHVMSWSNPGDVVLDPFSGSGTTCKAAKELNRQWCGIEINPEYCKIAEERLRQNVLQLETPAMRHNVES
jgi:DNA modification methylase